MQEIYEPAEDTFLLAKAVKKLAIGKILEIGTGSGYLANSAIKAKSVLAVDINKDAIKHCKKRYAKNKKLTFAVSNLFSNVKGQFDIIIFNPPYLPYDSREPEESQLITTGGKHGYELLVKFILQSSSYLKENGKILVVFSSLTNKNKIDEAILQCLYEKKLIGEQKVPHEILYVYQIEKNKIRINLEKKGLINIHFFAKGKHGLVFTADYAGKKNKQKVKVAVKIHNPLSSAECAIYKEAKMLPLVNKLKIGPKFIDAEKDYVIYEFIQGEPFQKLLPNLKKNETLAIIKKIIHQLFVLDNAGIVKEEMSNPYKHIIIEKNKHPVLIDFERSHISPKQHNVTQFCTYLLRLRHLLLPKKISVTQEQIVEWAKDYTLFPEKKRKNHLDKLLKLLSCGPSIQTKNSVNQNYYDKIASGYDELHGKEQEEKRKIISKLIDFKGKVLDVGCGSGLSFQKNADFGIDPSFMLLKKAKKRSNFLIQAMGEYLPYKNKSFSIVQCVSALHNFEDFELGIKEMKRVAKDFVIISVLKKSNQYKKIIQSIERNLKPLKIIEESHDTIFLCKS